MLSTAFTVLIPNLTLKTPQTKPKLARRCYKLPDYLWKQQRFLNSKFACTTDEMKYLCRFESASPSPHINMVKINSVISVDFGFYGMRTQMAAALCCSLSLRAEGLLTDNIFNVLLLEKFRLVRIVAKAETGICTRNKFIPQRYPNYGRRTLRDPSVTSDFMDFPEP